MKKALLFFLIMFSMIQISAEKQTYSFIFDEGDFQITSSSGDSLSIASIKKPAMYPDASQPCIPSLSKNVALMEKGNITNIYVDVKKRLVRTSVKLQNASEIYSTDVNPKYVKTISRAYEQKIYPDTCCSLRGTTDIDGIRVLNFAATPYIYDAQMGDLYFIDSMTVTLDIERTSRRSAPIVLRKDKADQLRYLVENFDEIDNVPVMQSNLSDDERVEYLIITKNSLKPAFEPLAEWKRKKGVPSKITTLEEIVPKYSGRTNPMRIKEYIKDMYENYGTMFVLLGGDVLHIPTVPCYVNVHKGITGDDGSKISPDIPADIYYSCLESLEWDTNGDGRYGEYDDDSINITPVVYVTRAPVRDQADVKVFVDRTIEYEQAPNSNYALLQAGYSLNFNTTSEEYADLIYNKVIYGKAYLESKKFFDTYTYSGEKMTQVSFTNELSKGYQFAEIISHGLPERWCDHEMGGETLFHINNARDIKNSGHTLITTAACFTNKFDTDETYYPNPCLSEALFRNPNSGIIGYIGSSRQGWYNGSELTNTLSIAYESTFYEGLLYDDIRHPQDKNFGLLMYYTKSNMAHYSGDALKYHYRWLFYSVNAIGVPETPIFSKVPSTFYSAQANKIQYNNLNIKTGIKDARVCVSSKDNSSFYEIQYGDSLVFNTGKGNYDVWITKQNYIPKHFEVNVREFNPGGIIEIGVSIKQLSISPNPVSSNVTISYQTSFSESDPVVSMINENTGKEYIFDVSNNASEATIDISALPQGYYIVRLKENNVISENHIKLYKK